MGYSRFKKILLLLVVIFTVFVQSVLADEKITSVNYDTSANMLYLMSNAYNANSEPIKITKLSNPNRIYFDIKDAVLTAGQQNFQISSGGDLRQILISQNSTNPNIVRVVVYLAENYKTDNVKLLKLKNNYIVTFNNKICLDANYMHTSYRDVKFETSDYYSFISMVSQAVSVEEKPLNNTASATPEKVLNQIQVAFENSTVPVNIKTSYQNANVTSVRKDFKLKTRYYLNSIQPKSNGILLSGIGSFSMEKPMKLGSPERLVFDMPNTYTNPNLRSKIFKYGNDTIRVGQFEANKSRVVISTDNADKYIPIYSADNQSILIADKENLSHDKLTSIMTNLASSKVTKTDASNYGLNFYFTKPVVYAVKRENTSLTLYFFNAVQYNDQDFKATVRGTEVSSSRIDLMPRIGLRYSIQLDKNDTVKVYTGADARTVKLAIKTTPKEATTKRQPESNVTLPTTPPEKIIKRKSGEKVVVIDPGHGGTDYGAIRAGINEKDITLDVSKRVASILRSNGYRVHLTLNEDKYVSLQGRVDIAEEVKPDIFVSIHVNSSEGTTATGIETHYYHDYSIDLAKKVHTSLASSIKSPDRGLFKSKFYVINHTTMPAILVEIGFISNEQERAELVSEKRKQATAKAIAEGIMNYYKQQQK